MLTSWHGDTKGLALWSLSLPIGGLNGENVTVSRCEAIYGGCRGASIVLHAFCFKRLHCRDISQDVLCLEREVWRGSEIIQKKILMLFQHVWKALSGFLYSF